MNKDQGSRRLLRVLPILFGLAFISPDTFAVDAVTAQPQSECLAPGTWLRMADNKPIGYDEVLRYVSGQRVVLLGEHHDNADHHRWQLQVVAGLYALHPDLVIGLEMFPQEVQPVLDKWVAGKLSEAEFLKQSNWYGNWSFDPKIYTPLFHFARINHIPMIALNVNRKLFNEVQEKGWEKVPREDRQGITDPAPPIKAYVEMLASSFMQHHAGSHGHQEKTLEQFSPEEKKAFKRFVEGQQLWDRAMAQNIANVALRDKAPLVVGIMGSGHVMDGFGVPHQLAALGVKETATLVPWDEELSCEDLVPDFAYAVFGLEPVAAAEEDKPHLGVYLESDEKGVRVANVVEHSIAAASGIAPGDLIVDLGGSPASNISDVISVVQRMVPGTWLPITVQRGDKRIAIVAKFPAKVD
jgi:uncharacterized iron-regulated protein